MRAHTHAIAHEGRSEDHLFSFCCLIPRFELVITLNSKHLCLCDHLIGSSLTPYTIRQLMSNTC